MYRILLMLLLSFWFTDAFSQVDTEFWFAAPEIDDVKNNYDKPIILRLTSQAVAATVTISIPANPAFTPVVVNLGAGATRSIDLTYAIDQLENTAFNTVVNKGLHISSTALVSAYYELVSAVCLCNPEIFALKGRNALGKEFYVISQNNYDIDSTRYPNARTAFDIVATENNTTVTITPSQPVFGHPAGVPFTITLNRGQTFSTVAIYRSGAGHLGGSHIVADKQIAVTIKDDLLSGDGLCADLIGDQMVPVNVTGQEYIFTKGLLQPGDRGYIMAIEDNTQVFKDGSTTPVATLAKGATYMFSFTATSAYIKTSKNTYAYHLTGVGCELGSAIMPRINCTGSTSVSVTRANADPFSLMITVEAASAGNFITNGSSSIITAGMFTPVPGTNGKYVTAKIDLSLSTLPVNGVVKVVNTNSKFSMGLMNGANAKGCAYGFFSDYKASTVKLSQAEVCLKDSVQLEAVGGVNYEWSPAIGLSHTNIANPKASPPANTEYKVLITTDEGCVDSAVVMVNLHPKPNFAGTGDASICKGTSTELTASGGDVYTWSSNALNPRNNSVTVKPEQTTTYSVYVKENTCKKDTTIEFLVNVHPLPLLTVKKSNDIDCSTISASLLATGADFYKWSPAAGLNNESLANPVATITSSTKFTVRGLSSKGCESSMDIMVNVKAENLKELMVPNAFTPNNDGVNDCFSIKKWGPQLLTDFSIYNRYGQKVFSGSHSSHCWDGLFKGQPQPSGAYVFVIRARTVCGEVKRTGTLLLIR